MPPRGFSLTPFKTVLQWVQEGASAQEATWVLPFLFESQLCLLIRASCVIDQWSIDAMFRHREKCSPWDSISIIGPKSWHLDGTPKKVRWQKVIFLVDTRHRKGFNCHLMEKIFCADNMISAVKRPISERSSIPLQKGFQAIFHFLFYNTQRTYRILVWTECP
jgi:hypothetical protein